MAVHVVTVAQRFLNLDFTPPSSETSLNTTIEQHLCSLLMAEASKGRKKR